MHRAFLVTGIFAGLLASAGVGGIGVFGCGGLVDPNAQGTDDNGTIDSDSGVSRGDSGPSGVVANGQCPTGLPGPDLIPLEDTAGVPYCIDATEVTNGDYADFLATNPQPSSEPGPCSEVTSYAPAFGWPADRQDYKIAVVNVDWCDARAYCAWAGKKLCGAPGGVSGIALDNARADTSLWYSACSDLGYYAFPYGPFYQPTTCNGVDAQYGEVLETDLPGSCVNSSTNTYGLLDMSGNVWEWEDACEDDTPDGKCRLRGGSFRSNQDSLACAASDLTARNSKFDDFGFRCCKE